MLVKHFSEVKAERPPTLQLKGKQVKARATWIRWLVSEKTAGKNYTYNFALRYFTMKARGGIPLHEHEYDEAIFVLKGRIIVETGTSRALLRRGYYAYLGPSEPHGVYNPGPGEASFLCCISYRHAREGRG